MNKNTAVLLQLFKRSMFFLRNVCCLRSISSPEAVRTIAHSHALVSSQQAQHLSPNLPVFKNLTTVSVAPDCNGSSSTGTFVFHSMFESCATYRLRLELDAESYYEACNTKDNLPSLIHSRLQDTVQTFHYWKSIRISGFLGSVPHCQLVLLKTEGGVCMTRLFRITNYT